MWLPFNILSLYRFGNGDAAPTPPPTPPPTTVTTQTFQGFGGGFLGPYHKRRREEIYAKAQYFGAPPVYRFNKASLVPALTFTERALEPILQKAAEAPSQIKRPTIWMKFRNTPVDPEIERKRKLRKRQREEDEIMLMLL